MFQTLTGSTDIQDEDDVTELLNAISAANENTSPPTSHIKSKPKLHKRDTDTVLSSLLDSLKPPPSPPESLTSVDPQEFDSQWESGYSDNDASPDLVANKLRRDFFSGSSSSTQDANVSRDSRETSNDTEPLYQANMGQLEPISENNFADDSNVDDSSDDDDGDDYINMDDEDVFDMLRDNSELVIDMLNNNKPSATETVDNTNLENTDGNRSENSVEAMDRIPDVPPPIPTTPLPSDDDEPPVKPPPRRESLPKFSASGNSYSATVMNGAMNGHSR